MGGVYAVASAKGGVGKTTTVAALGATLATAGYEVVAVDADLGAANLASTVGIDPDGATVHDVLAGTASVEEATYAGPAGLDVIPGATDLDSFRRADPTRFEAVVGALDGYDVVLLDTGAGLSHDTVAPLEVVDAVVLVSGASDQSLGDTDKSREVAVRLGKGVAGAVFTRTDQAPAAADRLGVDALAAVPDDPVVDEALAAGTPVSTYAPTSDVAVAYRTLASTLVDDGVEWPTDAEDASAASEPADEGSADAGVAIADADGAVTVDGAEDPDGAAESGAGEDRDAPEDAPDEADAPPASGADDATGEAADAGDAPAGAETPDDGGEGEGDAPADEGSGGERQRGFLGRLFR